ncbi:MAG: BamA/TamA family outer membrane protein [Proteobacteria bacterium]|nr:BamA/TamA family outer membrane protein [Pseudomonadota bacterium]
MRLLLTLLMALALSGCAALTSLKESLAPPQPVITDTELGLATSAPDAGTPPVLDVRAPEPLKGLLEQYLELARAIRSPEARLLSNAEWARLASAAPAEARALAQTEGWFDALATATWDNLDGEGPPRVVVTVTPGDRARVGRLTFEVHGALAEAANAGDPAARALRDGLFADWLLPENALFRNAVWGDAKAAILTKLRAQGYAAATWSGTGAQVDATTHRVRIYLVADSGPLFQAGEITVTGTNHHDAAAVQALAGFKRGDALTETRLLDYQARLLKTGLYDQISVLMEPDVTLADAVPVQVNVREAPLQSATTGVGYAANLGLNGTLEYSHRRVFGQPLTSRQKLLLGQTQQSWEGELATHTDASFSRWVLGGTLERLDVDGEVTQSARLRLGRSRELPEHDRLVYAEVEDSRLCTDGYGCERSRAVSAHVQHIWRRLDSQTQPTDGWALNTQVGAGLADGNVSKRGLFGRVYGRVTGFWPLATANGKWYAQGRLEAGAIIAKDGVVPPDSQLFRAGGDESVRGYGWRSLSPSADGGVQTGGLYLLTASAEIARPLFEDTPAILWAAFVDAGNAGDSLSELKPAVGIGGGLRVRSPIGPLKVDLAYGERVHRWRLHLSVGLTF